MADRWLRWFGPFLVSAMWLCALPGTTRAQSPDGAVPSVAEAPADTGIPAQPGNGATPPLPSTVMPPPSGETTPPSTTLPPPEPSTPPVTGRGTGPGVPWQMIWALQLVAYAMADALPYVGCVVGSWLVSLTVPFGPGVALPAVISIVAIPPVACLSGCSSAALLGWLGDRLGTLRGRLACVGCSSVSLSALTYALVIAPITIGMGFFAVATYTFLASNYVLPRFSPPQTLAQILKFTGYSVSAAGAVGALAVVVLGSSLAPVVGFVLRPVVVAFIYRWTGRQRYAGEEQWPPSLLGERSDLLPFIGRDRDEDEVQPAATAPAGGPVGNPPQDF